MKMDEFSPEEFMFVESDSRKKEKKRSDLISKKLGELLLQGFRMLNSTCEKCECVLMQRKNEPLYCVGCQDKDILALNPEEKHEPLVQEIEQKIQPVFKSTLTTTTSMTQDSSYVESINIINEKISWASEQLKGSNVLSYNLELLEMIKKASEAIISLKKI